MTWSANIISYTHIYGSTSYLLFKALLCQRLKKVQEELIRKADLPNSEVLYWERQGYNLYINLFYTGMKNTNAQNSTISLARANILFQPTDNDNVYRQGDIHCTKVQLQLLGQAFISTSDSHICFHKQCCLAGKMLQE